jgi:hypothetical protein
MPNGADIPSTHTCELDLPELPPEARASHILPGLSAHSLLSMAKFCDTGCNVQFTKTHCQVFRDGHLLLQGPRDPVTNLWLLPLCPDPGNRPETPKVPAHYGYNAHRTTSKAELLHNTSTPQPSVP